MMKIKDIVAIVTVALVAGGCSQQDDGTQQDERVPILLKAFVDVEAVGQTRAAGDWGERTTTLTQGSEFLAGEQVIAYIKENDGTNTANIKWPIEYAVVNGNGDLDPVSDAPFYYPVGVNTINIHAIHPSYTSDAGFTVETDQTTEANYAKSDLCYSKPRDYTRSGTTAYLDANGRRVLQFKHLLSKIIVNLTVDATAATSAPSYISLHAKTTTAMTFPVDNANGYTGCTASDASYPGVIKMKQEAIIPPQDIAAGASFISMNVPGIGSMIYPMPTATSFESGKKYTYNLKVTDVGITATTNVTDWGTKVANQTVIGKQGKYKLNPLWYVAKYNLNSDCSFNTSANTSQGYLFTWTQAMNLGYTKQTSAYDGYDLPDTRKTVLNDEIGTTWHLPTHLEYHSILPNDNNAVLGYTANTVVTELACTFGYNNDTKYGLGNTSNPASPTGTAFKAYWGSCSGTVMYAIRFLDSDYCSVWRYRRCDSGTTTGRLEISARLIPTISSTETTKLSTLLSSLSSEPESYWAEDESNGVIQRNFYCCGYNTSAGNGPAPGSAYSKTCGYHWAASQNGSDAYLLHYNFESNTWQNLFIYLCAPNTHYFSVRLFRDN